MNLKGKRVLITGSSNGIGAATAKVFSAAGADVIITYHKDAEGAKSVAGECEEHGTKAHILQLDVTDDTSIEKAFTNIDETGGIDILVNNAGIAIWKPLKEMTFDEITAEVRTNVEGLVKTTRRALDSNVKKVINIASGAGKTPYENLSVYCATKAAVQMFTKAAKNDVEMITVNPGMTATRMTGQRGVDPRAVATIILRAAENTYDLASGEEVDVGDHL